MYVLLCTLVTSSLQYTWQCYWHLNIVMQQNTQAMYVTARVISRPFFRFEYICTDTHNIFHMAECINLLAASVDSVIHKHTKKTNMSGRRQTCQRVSLAFVIQSPKGVINMLQM